MSAVVILIFRILLAASLYAFVGWAIYTIWRELRVSSQLVAPDKIPAITLFCTTSEGEIVHQFTDPQAIIGRDPDCDFALPNETVSAHHARLRYHHNHWWIEDLRSTNGTFLNDERVETPTVIISGDELRCGSASIGISFLPKG